MRPQTALIDKHRERVEDEEEEEEEGERRLQRLGIKPRTPQPPVTVHHLRLGSSQETSELAADATVKPRALASFATDTGSYAPRRAAAPPPPVPPFDPAAREQLPLCVLLAARRSLTAALIEGALGGSALAPSASAARSPSHAPPPPPLLLLLVTEAEEEGETAEAMKDAVRRVMTDPPRVLGGHARPGRTRPSWEDTPVLGGHARPGRTRPSWEDTPLEPPGEWLETCC
ncbi:unnamed protein product [Gadus morhua 'NCC']